MLTDRLRRKVADGTAALLEPTKVFHASLDCSVFMAHSHKQEESFILKPRSGEGKQSCRLLPRSISNRRDSAAGPCQHLLEG
jgi:hypothetical protein